PQPEIGQFWLKVDQKTCGTAPKLKLNYTPKLCNHCENAPCIAAAKDGAVYRREDGLVIIDPEKARGQKKLAEACPYGAIYWNEELALPQKCTGCAHLLDNGWKTTRCAEACPTEALRFGDEEELADDILGASVMQPETGCHPRVYYRNIPGQFIAGLVYDPVEKEVIIGAKCRLVTGAKVYETVTDDYGDFWFKDLPVGRFDLYIEAKGFQRKIFEDLRTVECLNLGDIPMERE
ncbi:MAG: 4Fe-4S dicluster domain-containing protein, partial [Oscillospiraceae bacterium]